VLGKKTSTVKAIEAAVGILRGARSPFVYGLSRSATATARRAAEVARALGGAIDVEGSDSVHADLVALSTFGLPSATFGEIRDRADTVLPVDRGADLDVASSLRALLNGAAPDGGRPGGVPLEALRGAAARLLQARYSAVLWDSATSATVSGLALVATLTLLARDLNRTTRSVARPLGVGGNVAGAVAALAAATGYPRAIGFGEGAPRFAPGEFGADRMIGERRADVLVLVGARSAGGAPPGRRGNGPQIIVIGPRTPRGSDDPDVWIPTATPGLSAAGSAARADGMTVVLKALLPTRRPTEDDVLDALLQRLGAGNGARGG
jgi:formylmethanofuran dehydrogenase subunit B